jgi:hypothetical protein
LRFPFVINLARVAIQFSRGRITTIWARRAQPLKTIHGLFSGDTQVSQYAGAA